MLRRSAIAAFLIVALSVNKPARADIGGSVKRWCSAILTWAFPPPTGLRFGSPHQFDIQGLLGHNGINIEWLRLEDLGTRHVSSFHDLLCVDFRLHYGQMVVGDVSIARERLRGADTYAYLGSLELHPRFRSYGLEYLMYFFAAYEADRRWNNVLQISPLAYQRPDLLWEELAQRNYAVYARNHYMMGSHLKHYHGFRFRKNVLAALRSSELAVWFEKIRIGTIALRSGNP